MGRLHHKRGCIVCGKRRKKKHVLSGDYDVYMRDKNGQTLIRVGLCKSCFQGGKKSEISKMKKNLLESEKVKLQEDLLSDDVIKFHLKKYKDADIDKTVGVKEYQAKFKEVHPQGTTSIKTPKDYFDLVDEV